MLKLITAMFEPLFATTQLNPATWSDMRPSPELGIVRTVCRVADFATPAVAPPERLSVPVPWDPLFPLAQASP